MKIIGLTGGSGAGKSVASLEMQKLGAGVVDADEVYRYLCNQNKQMLCKLESEFGDILLEDGTLDRKKLAKIVFSDSESLDKLNNITYPYIMEESKKRFDDLKQKGFLISLYDAPTLFQNGAQSICDAVIGVVAKKQTRIERIIKRDGISKESAIARIESQPDDNFYYERCDYILENDVSHETFVNQIKQLFEKLTKLK